VGGKPTLFDFYFNMWYNDLNKENFMMKNYKVTLTMTRDVLGTNSFNLPHHVAPNSRT
jgi:hypothetical protein